jgi:hypothetical protein
MTTKYVGPLLATATLTRGKLESESFTRALLDLAAAGLRTNCSDPKTHHLWLLSAPPLLSSAPGAQSTPIYPAVATRHP